GPVGESQKVYASDFDHDFEVSTPYYYEADLLTWGIKAELTATKKAAYYRFTFPSNAHSHLAITLQSDARLAVVGNNAVQGSERILGPISGKSEPSGETREYFYAEFSRPFQSWQTWHDKTLSTRAKQEGDSIGFVSDGATMQGEKVEVRIGMSYISVEQARKNLEQEIPDWTFNRIEEQTKAVWDHALDGIQVSGGTRKQRTIFYTALYRSLGRMTDITEGGQYFSGYDHHVHNADGHDFYIDDGTWDTFRSLHPLQLLLDPGRQEDMIRSYLRMYEQSGWLPSFPSVAGEQAVMIGHHADEFILDAYEKGYRDFDVQEAYAAMRKNATEATMLPWQRGPL